MRQTLFRLTTVDSPPHITSRLHNTNTETAIRGNLIDCSMSNESMLECLYMDSHNEYRVGSMDVDMMRDGTASWHTPLATDGEHGCRCPPPTLSMDFLHPMLDDCCPLD